MGIMDTDLSRRGFLASTLVAAAGVITLTACGSDSSGDGGDGALVMTVWGGEVDKAAYQARIDALVEAHPEMSVTLQLILSDSYAQKVQTMIAGGSGPDIMQVAENVNVYSSKNQLLPLDEHIASAGLDLDARFGPVGTVYSYEGSVYAVPDRSGASIHYYNKGMFDAAGIAAPTADWTWDDMLSAAQELTVPGEVWGYAGAGWWPTWWSFAYQNGGRIIDDSGRPAVDTDAVIEALQFCGDLVFKHKVVPSTVDYANMGTDMGGDPAFAAGLVAMNTTGFWNVGSLAEQDTVEWDIAPMWRGKEQAVATFGSGLAISRTAKDPALAFTAIDFLTSDQAQPLVISMKQDVPANVAVQESDAFLSPEWMTSEINMQAFPESAAFALRAPFIPEWNEMQQAFTDGLADFWLGKQEAAPALQAIQGRLESIIQTR